MQTLFAHTILRLGGKILQINTQGHPDIRAQLGDREMLVQVKTSAHRSSSTLFELGIKDFTGIVESGRRQGILALLDCAAPVRWIVVEATRAKALVGRSVTVAMLWADCEQGLSIDCTEEFTQLILRNADVLQTLTYAVLMRRALRGTPI